MPSLMGKSKKKQELIDKLEQVYGSISRQSHIPLGDFPEVALMQTQLGDKDFSAFPTLKSKLLDYVDTVLSEEIPKLMQMIPQVRQLIIYFWSVIPVHYTPTNTVDFNENDERFQNGSDSTKVNKFPVFYCIRYPF